MLKGYVKPINEYTNEQINKMYQLMNTFYDNMNEQVFLKDFMAKDYCLSLYADNELVGFTTQKVLEVEVDGKSVHGVFSGDTIIHKDYWGDIELFRVWGRFWFEFAKDYDEFYWFLICKGYKTYGMLPLFWKEYYPCYKCETPEYEKKLIDAYGKLLYPDEYNPVTGVIEYRAVKDKLKTGVADVGERQLKRKEYAYFVEKNPGYEQGNDIACLAKIDFDLLKRSVQEILFNDNKDEASK